MDSNKIEKLKQLSELYKEGILTKEELEIEKQKVLSDNLSDGSSIENKKDLRPLVSNLDNPDISSKKESKERPHRNSDNGLTNIIPTGKKFIYLVATIVLLIGIGVFFGIYQHHQSIIAQQKEQDRIDSIAEMERLMEIRRQDSIAEVQRILEIQRQESIRRDSIEKLKNSPIADFNIDSHKYLMMPNEIIKSNIPGEIGRYQNKGNFYKVYLGYEDGDGIGLYMIVKNTLYFVDAGSANNVENIKYNSSTNTVTLLDYNGDPYTKQELQDYGMNFPEPVLPLSYFKKVAEVHWNAK